MGTPLKDVILKEEYPKELLQSKHVDFLVNYGTKEDNYMYGMTDYLRMSGIYWTLTALDLLGESQKLNQSDIIEFVKQCQDPESGGIAACVNHDPHILYTLSAVQILCIYDEIKAIDVDGVVKYIVSLQKEDGSFMGDKWGEVDTRFSFCALACLSLLHRLDAVNVDKASEFVASCMNFDGGFGSRPLSESHAGLVYCCLGALSVTARLHLVDADKLAWWLAERQLPSGGLNGRPEKLPDVCYSWWVLSSLSMLDRLQWVDSEAVEKFVLGSQDTETGGFSDRPGDLADPYHTLFGLAALSLLGRARLPAIHPVYCMPKQVINRLGLQ